MNKVIAGVAAAGALAISLGVSAVPAQAGDSENISICHDNNGKKDYSQITVDKHSIVKKTGGNGGHGNHEGDIIPPFTYNFGGSDKGSYPGQNWVPGTSEALLANGCATVPDVPDTVPVSPILAVPVIGTCVDPTGAGAITVPKQSGGVVASAPVLSADKTHWVITFTKPTDTEDTTFVWDPASFDGTQEVAITPPGPGDEYWDDKKDACNLPDTGAAEDLLLWGTVGGVAVLGGGIAMVATRRKNEA